MNKIIRLSVAKLKKNKRDSILTVILAMICTILLASSVSSLAGIGKMVPKIVEDTGCYRNMASFDQAVYTNEFLKFIEDDDRVKRYTHWSVASGYSLTVKGEGDYIYDTSFVSLSDEKKIERFNAPEEDSIEHPIWMNKAYKNKLEVEVGDEITYVDKNREYTFTVAGFYENGLWNLSSKAVVTDEDFAYLEQYLTRNETIGIDLKDGVDGKAFFKEFEDYCKDISVNDLSRGLLIYTYEDFTQLYVIDMAIVSIIVAIMAGLTIVAIMVMISFRIVGDIQDQIVSIGVLEALGYTSSEIALSYVFEYLILTGIGALLGIIPGVALTKSLMSQAALTMYYAGELQTEVIPFVLSIIGILLFTVLLALSKARSVRKYPPVKAFRKGIETHHFKKTLLPLENSRGNVHINLALKGFLDNMKQNLGVGFCIGVATLTVVLSFIICSFLGNKTTMLNSVCGHELPDIRLETTGFVDKADFASEIEAMPEVDKVLLAAKEVGIKVGDDVTADLEIYDDYSKTSTIVVVSGRLPEHENEIAMTTQLKLRTKANVGDTITAEYMKVKRDYVVTGFVNSVVNAATAYLTDDGFKRVEPSYIPNAVDIYLKDKIDEKEFADVLTSRYGKELIDISVDEVTGDTVEDRIRNTAQKKMAEAMIEEGVSYMEYAIEYDGQVISGSTNTMRITSLSYERAELEEMMSMLSMVFAVISIAFMAVAAIVVMIILSILMNTMIRKQYRELGIMKSMGYTSGELMFQLAFKLVPTALIAVILGTAVSYLLLSLIEPVLAKVTVSGISVLIVDLAILVFCFICAYLSSKKIKKISVRELMTE